MCAYIYTHNIHIHTCINMCVYLSLCIYTYMYRYVCISKLLVERRNTLLCK